MGPVGSVAGLGLGLDGMSSRSCMGIQLHVLHGGS